MSKAYDFKLALVRTNPQGLFLARFWGGGMLGLAYALALLYVVSRCPFWVGIAVYVATVAAVAGPYIVRHLRRLSLADVSDAPRRRDHLPRPGR